MTTEHDVSELEIVIFELTIVVTELWRALAHDRSATPYATTVARRLVELLQVGHSDVFAVLVDAVIECRPQP